MKRFAWVACVLVLLGAAGCGTARKPMVGDMLDHLRRQGLVTYQESRGEDGVWLTGHGGVVTIYRFDDPNEQRDYLLRGASPGRERFAHGSFVVTMDKDETQSVREMKAAILSFKP